MLIRFLLKKKYPKNQVVKKEELAKQYFIKEEKQTSRIYMKKSSAETIDEFIVYALGEDIAFIYIKGEIPMSALEGMAPENETEGVKES